VDAYIDDFVTKSAQRPGFALCNSEGWPGIHNPSVKDWLVKHPADGERLYVRQSKLTVAETRRLEHIGKALDEFLDKSANRKR